MLMFSHYINTYLPSLHMSVPILRYHVFLQTHILFGSGFSTRLLNLQNWKGLNLADLKVDCSAVV